MSQYRYRAVDLQGVASEGALEATSTEAVVDYLSGRSLFPTHIESAAPAPLSLLGVLGSIRRRHRLSATALLSFTQQLTALLRAGLTLERALAVAQQLSDDESSRKLFGGVRSRLLEGEAFAVALEASGFTLPGFYVSLVQGGEASGALPDALGRVSDLLQRKHQARERLVSALIYPAILLASIGVTLVLIISFVIPRFEALFAEAGATLPLPTRAVMALGRGFRSDGLPGLTLMALGLAASARWASRPGNRDRIDAWLHRRKLYRRLVGTAEAARFARTLGSAISGGVTVSLAFRMATATVDNRHVRSCAMDALAGVNAGADLATQLQQSGGFPSGLLQLVRVGLETGQLPATLIQAADILDEESRRTLDRAMSVLVPMVTIVMGLLVAGLIGSVLVGILSINDLAG